MLKHDEQGEDDLFKDLRWHADVTRTWLRFWLQNNVKPLLYVFVRDLTENFTTWQWYVKKTKLAICQEAEEVHLKLKN